MFEDITLTTGDNGDDLLQNWSLKDEAEKVQDVGKVGGT